MIAAEPLDLATELEKAIVALEVSPVLHPFSQNEADLQYRVISALRRILSCVPNERIKPEDIRSFMRARLNCEPTSALVKFAERIQRESHVTEDVRIALETRQNSRCSLCGTGLLKSAKPHVDHKRPISFGGENDIENYQLLCEQCNLGKSNTLHWVMVLPFFQINEGQEPSKSMRYAVLSRHHGQCSSESCANTSLTSSIHVDPIVPVQQGGRLVFDNLWTLCEIHHKEKITFLQSKARNDVIQKNSGLMFRVGVR